MRAIDRRILLKSYVGFNELPAGDPHLEQLDLTFTTPKGQQLKGCLDIGDRKFADDGKAFWAPLYTYDPEGNPVLTFVLRFNNDEDLSVIARANTEERRLPNLAESNRPNKHNLTEQTYEAHKHELEHGRNLVIGSTAAALLVTGAVVVYKKFKE